MDKLSDEQIVALRDGCEGVTPGPWMRSGVRHKMRDEDCLMVGPDGFLIAGVPLGRHPKEHAGAFRDAGFIAACDPSTIRALCDEILALRKAAP